MTLSQRILLKTTPGDQIPTHLAVNGRCRTCNRFAPFVPLPPESGEARVCECAEPNRLPMVEPGDPYWGKTLAICGAGPSLKDCYSKIRKAHHVWGCNRAVHYLKEWGWPLTHAFGIDAGTAMFEDCWKVAPPVRDEYLVATSVHPQLIDHLLEQERPVRMFHSIRGGVQDEQKLYRLLFPPSVIAGNGLNSVNRALGLAVQLGYKRIWICGADNALKDDAFYADGSEKGDHNNGAVYLEGRVHGRLWKTTPDMLMSATDLARMKWQLGENVELVGNTLPRALSLTSDEFLDRCIRWATEEEAAETREADEAIMTMDSANRSTSTVANKQTDGVD